MSVTIGKYYAVTMTDGTKSIGRNVGGSRWQIIILDESDLYPAETMDVMDDKIFAVEELELT